MSRYEVKEADDGSFYFVLLADNGEVVVQSETYTRREDAERGVQDAASASAAADGANEG